MPMKSIALIIPLKDEESTVETLVKSIKEQSLQLDEIIFVDGGSSDNTILRLKEFSGGLRGARLIEAGPALPGEGRNIGAQNTHCEWIAFTDAGIKLDPDWLKNLVLKTDEDPSASLIYGNYSPITDHFFEKCAAIAYVPPSREGRIRAKTIASCLLKKEVWEKTGGFPAWRATEDLVFMEKAEQLGYKAGTAPAAMLYWYLRPGLSSTYKKFKLYSKWNVWAGRQAYWHYGLLKQYMLIPLSVLAAIFHRWYWLLLIPVWMLARVMKRIFDHRREFGISSLFNPAIIAGVFAVTFTIDMATFAGWIQALVNKRKYRKFSAV